MFVLQLLSQDLIDQVARWNDLKRWERKEIGQTLRRMGLSYKEIAAVIPVHKGTLSGWCRDLGVPNAMRARIGTRSSVGQVLRARALERAHDIRRAARSEAVALLADPMWVAGVVAYWSEGSKRSKEVSFANSDPELIALFIAWAERYLDADRETMTAKLHLHDGQDEVERITFWSSITGIPRENFRKTFVKPQGSGHRKNILYNGTIQVRVRRSTALLHRVLGWTDAVANAFGKLDYTSAGR